MKKLGVLIATFIMGLIVVFTVDYANAEPTVQEILQKVADQGFKDSFRAVLNIKTSKGKKTLSDQTIWVIGRVKGEKADFFFDFDEPEQSRGLRFLLQIRDKQDPKAFMFLPSTGKILPLATEDPSADIGGTGLNMDDLMGFIPKAGETLKLLKDEAVDSQDCFVVQITRPDHRVKSLWVRKKDHTIIKSQEFDPSGKVKRTFKVTEFFKTADGKDYPREEEITVPDKNLRISVRQENAVFGIDIPDELMDQNSFGQFKWRN